MLAEPSRANTPFDILFFIFCIADWFIEMAAIECTPNFELLVQFSDTNPFLKKLQFYGRCIVLLHLTFSLLPVDENQEAFTSMWMTKQFVLQSVRVICFREFVHQNGIAFVMQTRMSQWIRTLACV